MKQCQGQVQDFWDSSLGTGKDVYWNQVQLEQINSMGEKKGGKIIVQEVDAGSWWMPIVGELIAPVVKKVFGSGMTCSASQMEKKLKKELKAAGFFTDLAKNLAKSLASKAVQGVATAVTDKAAQVAQKGTTALLDTVEKKITGQGKKKCGAAIQIGGCVDGPCQACSAATGGKCATCEGGTVKSRNAMVKKRVKQTGKSLPEVSADIKRENAYKSRAKRNELVRKIMKEEGLSLPMASRAVKERQLKY